MKRITFIVVTVLVLFSSCVTLIPENTNGKGLLVVSVNGERNDEKDNYAYYRLYYDKTNYIVVYPYNDFQIIKDLDPGN